MVGISSLETTILLLKMLYFVDSLSPTDLTVQLSRKTAKQLHRRWALTLQEKFASEEFAVDAMIKNGVWIFNACARISKFNSV